LDASGTPVMGADGKPLVVTDARVPPGGSIGAGGMILDASGKPVLGGDGKPLIAGGSSGGNDGQGKKRGGASSPSPRFEYIPMGRMVTLRNMRAANIPASSGKKSDPNPYLLCALLNETGNEVDVHKTGHLRSVSSCDWMGELHAVRVFTKPDPGGSDRHKPRIALRVSLMDWNRKSEHRLIAKWDVAVKGARVNSIAKGRRTLDIPTSSGSHPTSSERAYITFEYEVTPQMVLPQVEEGEDSEVDEDGFDDDDTDDGASANVGVD